MDQNNINNDISAFLKVEEKLDEWDSKYENILEHINNGWQTKDGLRFREILVEINRRLEHIDQKIISLKEEYKNN